MAFSSKQASSMPVLLQVTSLRRLLDNDILEHLERIGELSDSASREFSIEKALDKMVADWEGLAFELGTWKSTGTHILKGVQLAGQTDTCTVTLITW
jgi:dynein heavy chain